MTTQRSRLLTINRLFIKAIILLYLLSFSVFSHTGTETEGSLPEHKKVILTVLIDETGYFPFNYREAGEVKGFSVDILNYVKANSNYDFEFKARPWPRTLYLVEHGKADIVLTLFKTPKREQAYYFIEPFYGYEVNQFFTLAESKVSFNGQLQQLTPYSIGTLREYSYGNTFDQSDYLNKTPTLNEEVLFKLLLGKRVDMIIGNPFIFNKLAAKEKASSKIKAIMPYLEPTPVYMALTRKRDDAKEIKKTLEQLIIKLKSSPYYQELLEKYQLNFK